MLYKKWHLSILGCLCNIFQTVIHIYLVQSSICLPWYSSTYPAQKLVHVYFFSPETVCSRDRMLQFCLYCNFTVLCIVLWRSHVLCGKLYAARFGVGRTRKHSGELFFTFIAIGNDPDWASGRQLLCILFCILLLAAFLSAQLCEELNICLRLEGLSQLLLSSFLNRSNSFRFCLSPDSLCSVSIRQVTQHLLKLNQWNECLETIRKEIYGTDPS